MVVDEGRSTVASDGAKSLKVADGNWVEIGEVEECVTSLSMNGAERSPIHSRDIWGRFSQPGTDLT